MLLHYRAVTVEVHVQHSPFLCQSLTLSRSNEREHFWFADSSQLFDSTWLAILTMKWLSDASSASGHSLQQWNSYRSQLNCQICFNFHRTKNSHCESRKRVLNKKMFTKSDFSVFSVSTFYLYCSFSLFSVDLFSVFLQKSAGKYFPHFLVNTSKLHF